MRHLVIISSQAAFNCSKLTIETPQQRCGAWRRFGVFIVNFEHISQLCSSVPTVNFEHVIAEWVIFLYDLIALRQLVKSLFTSSII